MLFELNRPVTLSGAFDLLSDGDLLEEEMENLDRLLETPSRFAIHAHFANRLLTQPEEQLGGVRETIGNYLQNFIIPEVAEVFCATESTFDFSAIDQGKIILTTMPQNFQTERREKRSRCLERARVRCLSGTLSVTSRINPLTASRSGASTSKLPQELSGVLKAEERLAGPSRA